MQPIKQSGVIYEKPSPLDWGVGESGIPVVNRLPTRDWTPYKPADEVQYFINFDTMACVSFSALNIIETFLKFYLSKGTLSKNHLDFLMTLGFMDGNTNINLSDRFTAIASGTRPTGNTFPAVWNSIRNDGVLPERDLPFGGQDFNSYHDRFQLTEFRRLRAKRFLKYFDISYEWVFFSEDSTPTLDGENLMAASLMEAPLHIAVPIPSHHAEMLLNLIPGGKKVYFDSYLPSTMKYNHGQDPINFAIKAVVVPKANVPPLPNGVITSQLKVGSMGIEVTRLQEFLSYLGLMNVVTGFFGRVTMAAVQEFQRMNGINTIGEVGPTTRKKIKQIQKGNTPVVMDLVSAIIQVESGGDDDAIGDTNLTNHAYGAMQIRLPVCIDVNRKFGTKYTPESTLGNRAISIEIFHKYMLCYPTNITNEEKSRAWNGGPGWRLNPKATDGYWLKISKLLG